MSPDWVTALGDLAARGEPAVLVTVTSVRGSAPREAGAKMVVGRADSFGTIGGGRLEFDCIAEAQLMLDAAAAPVQRDYQLGPALGQCCGGAVSVLFERVLQPSWQVAVFGAGHVGRALVSLLAPLPCCVRWIDTRPELLEGCDRRINAIATADAPAEVSRLQPGVFVLVMTHDHQLDFDIVARALARSDLGCVGLIGSATKRARFASRLRARGLDPERLICPIGVPGAGGKLAAEIAISMAAQLLQLREQAPAKVIGIDDTCDLACRACAEKVRA